MTGVLKEHDQFGILLRVLGNYKVGDYSIFSSHSYVRSLGDHELLLPQVKLSVVDGNLNNGKEGEYYREKSDYCRAVSTEEFADSPHPRWIVLSIAFIFWVPGMFGALYIGPFFFSEHRAVCGILCVLTGLSLAFLALFLIHKAYLW